MANSVSQLRAKAGETEKITINLGLIDLGQIDLLVQEALVISLSRARIKADAAPLQCLPWEEDRARQVVELPDHQAVAARHEIECIPLQVQLLIAEEDPVVPDQYRAISVWLKSLPTNSNGSPMALASA
jgi:ribbon-helix-helix protein